MRWQKIAQLGIAAFVVVFVVVLVLSMRRNNPAAEQGPPATPIPDKQVQIFNPDGGKNAYFSNGRKVFDAQFGKHVGFADGRHLLSEGVRILTTRNGKNLTINAASAEIKQKGTEFESAVLKGDVWLTGEGGVDVRSDEATYTESEGIVRMPNTVAFRKGRLRGSGVGATYDLNREVLWLLDKATFTVAADKEGQGAMEGSAGMIGLARLEHYVRLVRDAHVSGDGRDMRANEITITLTPDDERVQTVQLRGNSRMTGGVSGPQSMEARDIDIVYGEDGRTLQTANLTENAVLQLAGGSGTGGKRIAGRTIHLALAPDGKTVTHLSANERVQVDLPAENNAPSKRIQSATLVANGTPDAGLRQATFAGKVTYNEMAPARRNQPVISRTATSESLQIETKAGLGAIEKADFLGDVKFTEAPDVVARAQRAVYHIERDRMELMPAQGLPGPPATVEDNRMSVRARAIEFTIGTRDMTADTDVSSRLTMKPSGRGQQTKVPSVLEPDKPVNVTANRLQYQGAASRAVYSGNVQLWQEQERDGGTIKGDTLILDDKTGNLEVNGNVVTVYILEETDKKTKEKKRTLTTGKANTFVFDDKRRLGIYTGDAQLDGPHGNLRAQRIEIYLQPDANEVERLEADAQGSEVVITEPTRRVSGKHLTYTAEKDEYVMVGTPVESIEEEAKGEDCRVMEGTEIKFFRGQQTGQLRGNITPARTRVVKCSTLKR